MGSHGRRVRWGAGLAAATVGAGALTAVGAGAIRSGASAAPSVAVAARSVGDDFNGVPIGAVPVGWARPGGATAGSVGVVAVPDAVNRSLEVSKRAAAGVAGVARAVDALAGEVRVEVRVRISGAGAVNALGVTGGGGQVAGVVVAAGRLRDAGSGRDLMPVVDGRWYVVRLVLHTAQRRFDVVVNGRQRLTGAALGGSASEVTGVVTSIADGSTGTVDLDDVSVRRQPDPSVGYLVADQFDDTPVGAVPGGYDTTSGADVAVQATPSGADRSLRIAKTATSGSASALRPFTAQTGVTFVRANLRTDEAAGTKVALYAQASDGRTVASLQFVNGWLRYWDGSAAHQLVQATPGEWYTVQLVVDVAARQFEVFVDGRRFSPASAAGQTTTPRWPFRDATATDVARLLFGVGDGQTGTVRVDDLLVYANRPSAPLGTTLDVRKAPYDAKGDGATDNTAVLQEAIDDVPDGGSVVISGGTFLTGTLRLKSNMTLWVARGATLLGSQDDAAYPIMAGVDGTGGRWRALLYCLDAHDVRIDGGGTIDGNGTKTEWRVDSSEAPGLVRPSLVQPTRSSDVSVRNVHLKDAGAWGLVPILVDGLLIADVTIDSNLYANRDGIDVVDSHDTLIERTSVWSDDDAICFKSPTDKAVDGVTLRLSTVGRSERANGIKFGTTSAGAFRNVTVEDVLVKHTHQGAVTLTAVEGGVASNLTFRRVTVDDSLNAFFVLLGQRSTTTALPGWVSGLRFEGISGSHLSDTAMITGQALDGTTYRVYDVLVSDVHLAVAGGISTMPHDPAEYTGNYPESSLWARYTHLPSTGLYVRHEDGLTVDDLTATPSSPDVRPLTGFSDVLDAVTG